MVLPILLLIILQIIKSKGSFLKFLFDDQIEPTKSNDNISSITDQGTGNMFEWNYANTSVWLSAASYCRFATLLSRTYEGYSEGFIPTHAISNARYDVQVHIHFLLKISFIS